MPIRTIAPIFPLTWLLLWRVFAFDSSYWQLLGDGYQLTADSAVAEDGSVYFTSARQNRIHKIDPNGRITLFKENSGGAHGIAIGPDGRLYAGQHDRKRIVALDRHANEIVVAEGVQTHHLIVSRAGRIYFAVAPQHAVSMLDGASKARVVTTEVNWPHGLQFSPDQSHLLVADTHTLDVMSFAIQRDGSLRKGKALYRLRAAEGATEADVGGMDFDGSGNLYVATNIGVQVFDRKHRLREIIAPPGKDGVNAVFFAGPEKRWLYVTDTVRFYRRILPGRR